MIKQRNFDGWRASAASASLLGSPHTHPQPYRKSCSGASETSDVDDDRRHDKSARICWRARPFARQKCPVRQVFGIDTTWRFPSYSEVRPISGVDSDTLRSRTTLAILAVFAKNRRVMVTAITVRSRPISSMSRHGFNCPCVRVTLAAISRPEIDLVCQDSARRARRQAVP